MTNEAVSDVLHRAMSDEGFLMRFRSDPESALEEFDLSEDEETALVEQDDQSMIEQLNEDIKAATIYIVIPSKS